MFRHQWLLVCVGLSFCFLFSCRASQHALEQPQTYVGQIYVIGNEPFTQLTLKLADGRTYLLDCPKEIEMSLLQLQGQAVRVTGKTGAQKPEGQSLLVMQAQTVKRD